MLRRVYPSPHLRANSAEKYTRGEEVKNTTFYSSARSLAYIPIYTHIHVERGTRRARIACARRLGNAAV